jgi:hypothetical protein
MPPGQGSPGIANEVFLRLRWQFYPGPAITHKHADRVRSYELLAREWFV